MSTAEIADLAYYASILNNCVRYEDAMKYAREMVKLQPVLSVEHREVFRATYKNAVDVHRNNLHCLNSEDDDIPEISDRLNKIRENEFERLKALCEEAIDIIEKILLPASSDTSAIVFYQKLKGDFYRYICEFAEEEILEKCTQAAEDSYQTAISTSDQALQPSDPIRLGTSLNYAVFKYEQCAETQKASDIIKEAIKATNNDFSQLSENSREEATGIIAVMETNLENWEDSSEITE